MKKQGFLKFLLSVWIITATLYAKVPDTVTVTAPEVKEYVAKLPLNDQEFVNKAIDVGNKFAALHIDHKSFYDEETDNEWNKEFNPLTTLSGDEWRKIWFYNLSNDSTQYHFDRMTCDKVYLKSIAYRGDSVTLRYESLIFGMLNFSPCYENIKFKKLNDRLQFELTVSKALKITNVIFLTKNSDAGSLSLRLLKVLHKQANDMKSKAPNNKTAKKDLELYKKEIKDIEEASAICKEY
ncbi:MAG: hypothetical protein NT103_04915 [Campylobacterales bacterium]|nr:hypothetical protein [Campylobacterales bacterium]